MTGAESVVSELPEKVLIRDGNGLPRDSHPDIRRKRPRCWSDSLRLGRNLDFSKGFKGFSVTVSSSLLWISVGVSTISFDSSTWFTSLSTSIASLVLVVCGDDVDPTLLLPAKEAK